jgi:hypothetical protein
MIVDARRLRWSRIGDPLAKFPWWGLGSSSQSPQKPWGSRIHNFTLSWLQRSLIKLHNGDRDPNIIQEPQFLVVHQQGNNMLQDPGSSSYLVLASHIYFVFGRYSQPHDRYQVLNDSMKIRCPPVSLFRVLPRNLHGMSQNLVPVLTGSNLWIA